ncbi:hypothetical protein OSTOST_13776 [Ostertagia ostertagi]
MLGAGQLVSEWLSAEEIAPHVQLGDLLEFRRVASIGGAPRAIYAHWAVYIGRHEDVPLVVHLSGGDGDFDKIKWKHVGLAQQWVRCDPLIAVAGENLVRINNAHDIDHQPFPPRIVVERATLQLVSIAISLELKSPTPELKRISFHVVLSCSTRSTTSCFDNVAFQAVAVKSIILGSALSAVGAPPALAIGAGFAFLTFATPVSKLINRYYGSNFSLF